MKFAHFFISRPIFAAVLSILIVVVGLIALFQLPIAPYPEVVPPTVTVSAFYPGASADVVAATVATPIEQEINGVEDMLYMSSQCNADGSMNLTVTFKSGTDLNNAQVQVQNRVSVAEPRLPEEVRRLGVTVNKRSPSITLVVHLLAPKGEFDELYIGNYAFLRVKDQLARLPGVGQVILFGARDYSMRIWIDPEKAASRNLTAGEIVEAIREQNVQVAAGVFGQQPQPPGSTFQLTARVQGRLVTEEEFRDIVVKTGQNGEITHLHDVARIELGAKDYSMESYLDGTPASALAVFQLPGSNALETADAIRAKMAELAHDFPAGLEYRIVYDTTQFVSESIHAVVVTLLEAMLLVVFVVVLFLQNWRASIIPLLAVPVSLIGTFAVMQLFGFSLNNLSLFGIVLAIGIVVDDAIVVVENVERNLALGLGPIEATRKAMDEVSGAVVAIAIVLCAVFVPTAFMSGLQGKFFQQFALTVAVSTVISAFNSLTLSPALAALLLRPHDAPKDWFGRLLDQTVGRFFRIFERLFENSRMVYLKALSRVLRHTAIGLAIYAGLLVLTWFGFQKVPTGFVPPQDKGYVIAYIQLPDGASLERTRAVSKHAVSLLKGTDGVAGVVEIVGLSIMGFGNSPNATTMFICLEPFRNRTKGGQNSDAIANQIRAKLASIQEGYVGVFGAPAVDGIGSVGGLKLQIQDRTGAGPEALQAAAYSVMAAANEQTNIFGGTLVTFRASVPQVFLDVDRAKAKTMNVKLSDVWSTLQVYLGSLYVNDFTLYGRAYQVTAQADAEFRGKPEDVINLKTRTQDGQMVPLGTLVNVRQTTAPTSIPRYNMYASADLSGTPAPGVSSGVAIQEMERIARKVLPPGMGFEWTELTLLEIMAGNSTLYIFPLCVLLVFLTLAALYESWSLPLAIILIVPMCLLSAILGVMVRGMDNNIFTQIGLVVLVGLACKNAILIVEFAKQLQEKGMSRLDAALEACKLRLRPILMTSFAFIFGVIPLMLARGAGAEMRQALGTAVFFGMLGVTFFGIFLTPIFYLVIRRVVERVWEKSDKEHPGSAAPGSTHAALASIAVLGLASFTLLSGCAVGPNYRQPESRVNATFANANQTNLNAGQTLALWWRNFHDAQLDRLVNDVIRSNHDLRIVTARVREARALRLGVQADYFPIVNGEAGYTKSLSSKAAFAAFGTNTLTRDMRETELYDAGFDALWELDLFGRVRRANEAARADLAASEANRRDLLVSLISEVARNYFELRGAQNQLAVARRNAANQRETKDMTESKVAAGVTTDLDASRARAQLNTTLASIPPIEASLQRAIYRLGVLTGRQPDALTSELIEAKPLPALPTLVNIGNPTELLRRRPDIRAAERSLAAATARIGVQTADLFPRVTFQGSVGLQADSFTGLGAAGADRYSFGPRISWAALDIGHVRSRIKAAGARAEAALANYEKIILLALEETENALVDFYSEQQRRDYLAAAARDSEQAVTLARERYQGGIADFLQVLDTQRSLLAIQDQLAASETRAATALVAVYKALGDGWQVEAAKAE